MPTLTKNKKILIAMLTVFLVLGFVLVAATPSAKAGFLDAITKPGEFVMNMLAWIAYGILTLFSKLVTLAAFLLKAVFDIEDKVGFTNVGVVTTGWTITRGLANMVIALILLIMSFDTILQINKFPIKTVLPRLIAVALLINFSLMFCGLIIDAAQILTRYFIDKAGGPSGDISAQLANGLSMANVFKTPTGLTEADKIQAAFGGGRKKIEVRLDLARVKAVLLEQRDKFALLDGGVCHRKLHRSPALGTEQTVNHRLHLINAKNTLLRFHQKPLNLRAKLGHLLPFRLYSTRDLFGELAVDPGTGEHGGWNCHQQPQKQRESS